MKKMKRLAALLLVLAMMLAGCGATPAQSPAQPPDRERPVFEVPPAAPGEMEFEAPAALRCRVVDGAEDGLLLLACMESSGVYRLNIEGLPVVDAAGQPAALENGMVVEVAYSGYIMESFPGQFGDPEGVTVTGEKDDLCSLYLQVLNDLWEEDSALNEGITELGVDLKETRLSVAEQWGVAWVFGEQHGLIAMNTTLKQLEEGGWLTPWGGSGATAEESKQLGSWEDGCFFTIYETPAPDAQCQPVDWAVNFTAMKWRGPLSAYMFENCTSERNEAGEWQGYTVGSWAIS